ncbi:MAG: hypothetical protein J6A30_01340 [Ruminococcus sp.]|nr:hypothetical protein [Ruminococcus sp.]
MNRNDLFNAIELIDDQYIESSESRITVKKSRKIIKRPLLFVAVILALANFTTIAFATKMFGLRDAVIDTTNPGNDITDIETNLSLSGFGGSNEYKAAVEWKEFEDSYDPDGSILSQVDQEGPENLGLDEKYNAYNVYTQEMADKVDEITEKYGLSLHTNCTEMSYEEMNLTVIDEYIELSSTTFNAPVGGYRYEDGTLLFDGLFENASDNLYFDYQLSRVSKGTFDTVFLNIGNIDDYQEQEITTDSGVSVIAALSEHKAVLIKEFDSCFVLINIMNGTNDGITFDSLDVFLNTFNFPVIESGDVDSAQDSEPLSYIVIASDYRHERLPIEMIPVLNSDATIAMATEYFSYGNENGSDIFTLNDWKGECPVYYKVTEFKGSTSEELAAQLTDKYADKYYSVDISQEEIGEYDALVMYFETDKEDFNDYQLLFYIIENDDGCVVIEVQLTLEMYQNIYAVIRNCINFFSMK